MHLPVAVQAALTDNETRSHRAEILQTPHVPAAAITTAALTLSIAARTLSITALTLSITALTWSTATMPANPAMALLAQLRGLAVEQRGVVRAMHLVTQGAVLRDGVVFPQKRPALLCMAGVAVLVHRQLLQGSRAGTAMRIVTVAADHLALPDRMPGGPESLGTDILVTAETDLGLGGALAHLVRLVDSMATDTGQVLAFVDTGRPVLKHATLVAAPTHAVLLVGWRRRVSRIGDQPALVATFIQHIDDVGFTRAVAGLATLSCKGGAQVHFLAVLVVVDLHDVRGMALATGLAVEITRATVGRCLRLFPGDRLRMQTAGAQDHEQ